MNDKGKTVTAISGIKPSYRRIKQRKGNPDLRCIEITMRLHLNESFPGDPGYAATMHAINTVTDRVLNICAEEFLP